MLGLATWAPVVVKVKRFLRGTDEESALHALRVWTRVQDLLERHSPTKLVVGVSCLGVGDAGGSE